MMESKEFRIGNLVKVIVNCVGENKCFENVEIEEVLKNEVYHTATGIDGQIGSDIKDLTPIDLSEIAIKLGFEELAKNYFSLNNREMSFVYYYTMSGSAWTFELNGTPIKIIYVHQFQNLYHIITGEDVSLNDIV